MIKTGLIGLGKMGISHLAILNSHPDLELVAVCDTNPILTSALEKYTPHRYYRSYLEMLETEKLDAVVVATPSKFHAEIVEEAIRRNLHIFCEKPFSLDSAQRAELAKEAKRKSLTTQVGYHFRFVGTFIEARRLVQSEALGKLHHVRVEAYGPVVLRPKGGTWRSKKTEGGGCLYDYASHGIDLINFIAGPPDGVRGTVAKRIFSQDVDDEVYSTLTFPSGATGQIAANWSDESFRKMSLKLSAWGTEGRLVADRQELHIYSRRSGTREANGGQWTVRNITELTEPVWYYLRGEEYSSQIDHFVTSIKRGEDSISPFSTAVQTDRLIEAMLADAEGGAGVEGPASKKTKFATIRSLLSGN